MRNHLISVEHLWDPLDRNIWKGMFGPNNPSAKRYIKDYEQSSSFFLRRQILTCIPAVVYILLPFIPGGSFVWGTIFEVNGASGIIALGFVFLLIAGWNVALFDPIRGEVAEELLARSMGWESFSHSIHKHWEQFRKPYRDVFDKGTRSQSFSHQFWGKFQGKDFWFGEWYYATDTGTKRVLRTSYTTKQVVIVPMEDNRFDGTAKTLRSGMFYGRKNLGIFVLDELWSDSFQSSLYFPDKKNEENKKIVEQKMCSVFKFKDTLEKQKD